MYLQGSYQIEGELSETRECGVWQTSGEVNSELWGSLVCVEVKVSLGDLTVYSGCKVAPTPRSNVGMAVGLNWKLHFHNTEAGFSGQYMFVA